MGYIQTFSPNENRKLLLLAVDCILTIQKRWTIFYEYTD